MTFLFPIGNYDFWTKMIRWPMFHFLKIVVLWATIRTEIYFDLLLSIKFCYFDCELRFLLGLQCLPIILQAFWSQKCESSDITWGVDNSRVKVATFQLSTPIQLKMLSCSLDTLFAFKHSSEGNDQERFIINSYLPPKTHMGKKHKQKTTTQ